jgi:hypothetical protein
MADNYQYQMVPIPQPNVPGIDVFSAAQTFDYALPGNWSTTNSPLPGGNTYTPGGGGTSFTAVVNVTWDSGTGQLVVTFSNGSVSNIPFFDCPT